MIKQLAIAVATVAFVASGMAQGVVANSNRDTARGVDAPVYQVDGTTALDSGFNMQLWGGADAASLAPISGISPFRDGNGAGYWNSPLAERTDGVAVPGVAAGGDATFQVAAWDAAYGTWQEARDAGAQYGLSDTFVTAVGSPALAGPPAVPAAPTALVGLSSFNLTIVPEPTTIALGLMGLGLVALRARKK